MLRYNTQFGITLNKRKPQKIVVPAIPQLLMAESGIESNYPTAQILLEQLQADFDIQAGEADMSVLDMPDMPPQQAPTIILAKAVQPSTKELYGTVGVCHVSPKFLQMDAEKEREGRYSLSPRTFAENIFSIKPLHPDDAATLMPDDGYESAEVTVLQPPKHGSLSKDLSPGKDINYYPDPDYVGNDKVIFLVNIGGHKVKVIHTIKVRDLKDFNTNPVIGTRYCPSAGWWKISQSDGSNIGAIDFASLQRKITMSALLADASQLLTGFVDLLGNAVGNTTGEGVSAQITLDDNAAGNGWFIDTTPQDNSEFLPTADSTIWKAKAGSAAYGKMDMLSVLLHEYGHALGIEHSADSHDFMATTLQPGERRLPSADELALMSQLVAQLKQVDASSLTSSTPTAPQLPFDPSLPLGGGFGLLAMGRLRRSSYGWTLALENVKVGASSVSTAASVVQYDVAANPTLNAAIGRALAHGSTLHLLMALIRERAGAGYQKLAGPKRQAVRAGESD